MNAKATLAVLLLSAGCTTDLPPTAVQRPIVGGTLVPDGEEPAVVAVLSDEGLCTGTLIAPRIVLTAAHCVEGITDPTQLEVLFGNDIFNPTRTVGVIDSRADRRFDLGRGSANDVALLRLASAVDDVTPVTLNTADITSLDANDELRAVGFGLTEEMGVDSGVKRRVVTPVVFVGPEVLRFGSEAHNICRGDSGGPQFYDFDGTERQVSITSATRGRCGAEAQGTRVDDVMDFASIFIDAWSGPCQIDGVCVTDCTGHPDPDCDPCGPEGTCAPDCPEIDYDCPPGLTSGDACEADTECEDRACYQAPDDPAIRYCTPACNSEGDCIEGQECQTVNGRPRCVFLAPTPRSQGQTCNGPEDCYSGVCERTLCATPCNPDADTCPDGTTCLAARTVAHACQAGGGGGGCAVSGGDEGSGGLLVFVVWGVWGVGGLMLVSVRRRARRALRPPR